MMLLLLLLLRLLGFKFVVSISRYDVMLHLFLFQKFKLW
jgi:hypothetical protein